MFPSTQMQFGQHPGVQPGAQVPVQIRQQAANGHGAANLGNHDFYLKVLSPENKKEYKTVTSRAVSRENIDTPTELKEVISTQCDGLNPESMEIGYFVHSKKLWINSRLDINDVWDSADKGEKLTLWCLSALPRETQKRKRDDQVSDDVGQATKRPAPQSLDERKAKAREYGPKCWHVELIHLLVSHLALQCLVGNLNALQTTLLKAVR